MAEAPSTPAQPQSTPAPAPSAPAKKVVIPVGQTGGAYSLETFNRAIGNEEPQDLEPEAEEDSSVGTLSEDFKEEGSEDEPSEKEAKKEEDNEDDSEEADKEEPSKEKSKLSGKGFKAKTADGKEIEIPEDAVIMHQVDGEMQEISLKDHLNMVAGELTVNQRLGKVASFKDQLDKERERIHASFRERQEQEQQVLQLCSEGKPESALCFLADKAGVSPVQLYKQMLANVVKAYNAFEGKSPAEIENHFLSLETQWLQDKQKKKSQEEQDAQRRASFNDEVMKNLQQEGISQELFVDTAEKLTNEGALANLDGRTALNAVIERALEVKHEHLVKNALSKKYPKLLSNPKMIELFMKYTNPHDYTEEDILAVAESVLGEETKRLASNLNKKLPPQERARLEKKSEAKPRDKRTIRTASELAKAFGL